MNGVDGAGLLDWTDIRPGLVRFLTRRTGCPAAAEDLTQDLWLRLQRSSDRVANPVAYLFTAAANAAFDWRQRELRSHLCDAIESHEAVRDEAPSPERIASSRQTADLLTSAIAELPPKCRTAFRLCRMEGLTMREAGKRMGVSERTIENHLAKATVHCRNRLLDAGAWP
ncbi:RNA polymerase sigma factor [Sphingomonas sp.]|uniref:RNA polymerase sigma factor n=1 Tax=Sphingomonas sp. TaxID=28214 RepID=UPI0025CC0EB5|nr:RNA polymerase sigma factor [Sphingomonas sp.]